MTDRALLPQMRSKPNAPGVGKIRALQKFRGVIYSAYGKIRSNPSLKVDNALCVVCAFFFVVVATADASAKCVATPVYQGATLRGALPTIEYPSGEIDRSRPVSGALAAALDAQLTNLVESQTSATSAAAAIWTDADGFWTRTVGESSDKPAHAFWWASVGKLATASIILQLVRDGELSLSDPIVGWFDGYPNADLITIDHLLTHTGGVFSFNSDKKLNRKRGPKSSALLIETSRRHGADFCPGTNWNYSNTGYVMLSRIAESITGESFADLVRMRLAKPLSLSTLRVVEQDDPPSALVAAAGDEAPGIAGIASIYGAGAIGSDAPDMIGFLSAYLSGRVTSPSLRNKAFSTLYPMFGPALYYGRGVMAMDVPDPARPTIWLGHAGGAPNARGLVVYDIERGAFASLVLNSDGPAEAIVNALFRTLDEQDEPRRAE